MLDRLSIPRRALDFEDYIDILRRNIRWIIGPAFAGLVISTLVAYLLDDTYTSKAMIRISPQQISTDMVSTVTTQDVSNRVDGMAQTILSRGALSSMIMTNGLYKEELKHEPMEDVVNMMRTTAIRIDAARGVTNVQQTKAVPAISIEFSYRDPHLANKVCAEIVSRFIDASSEGSLSSQTSTYQFLKDQFDSAKRTLEETEQKLSDYRVKNAGRLPDEVTTNISQMNALEQRLGSLSDAATRNSERRMMLDSSLHIARDRLAAVRSNSATVAARNERATELEKEISDLETRIAAMKDQYTDEYPDLQSARDRLATLKRQRDEAVKNAATAKPEVAQESPLAMRERMEAQAAIDSIQTQIKASGLEEQQTNLQLASVNASLHAYQSRVEQAPAGEKEYTDLQRDSTLARLKYVDAEEKLHKAAVATDLERRKQGETMELLESASLPTDPTAPKRAMIIPVGLVAGLILGVILVALREVRDTSLKNLKDARLYTQLSILGSIPLLENDVVVQRRKQVMWVGWATATIFGLAIIAGSVAHYYLSKT